MLKLSEVYLDGKFIGTHSSPKQLVESLIKKRRSGNLPVSINVTYYQKRDEVRVNFDGGRVRRPVIVLENGRSKLTKKHIKQIEDGKLKWSDLIEDHVIEYIDAEEEDNALVALNEKELTKKHNYLEMDPILILGVAASLLAYPERNRGDRLNYGSRMIVQSTGVYLHNYLLRDDTTSQILVYPQVPIVSSDTTKATGLADHPAGQNLIIAIMPYHCFNMMDAIILNKASLDRGLGRVLFYRTYVTEARKYWGGQEDILELPDANVRGYRSTQEYSKLGEDSIIDPETEVGGGEVLVGKTSPLRFLGVVKEIRMGIKSRRENSLTTNPGEPGVVEKIILTNSQNGNQLIKVSIREPKIPEIGDKFASRHGQKGIVGLIVPEEDMPFTADGITPDVIINPHAIPSRMTMGQLFEIIGGKAGSMAGEIINGTSFKGDEEGIRNMLKKEGFRDDGKETLYNGLTGEKMDAQILIGVGYYQRLYHMVSHKIHARSKGPVALLTKQPTEGRSKEGGLRFGEMEKDCLIAHGAAITLKERFGSDKTEIPVCMNCGITAIHDFVKGKAFCPICKSSKISKVEISYAFKLLLDELRSMLVYPQIIVGSGEK